jgi:tRNA(Ile)-lysidine synthase TilS/MesJ
MKKQREVIIVKATIFVRERRKVEKGEKKPRYAIVATAGTDLCIKARHIRKGEIAQIAEVIGAQVVYLEAGKDDEDIEEDD